MKMGGRLLSIVQRYRFDISLSDNIARDITCLCLATSEISGMHDAVRT